MSKPSSGSKKKPASPVSSKPFVKPFPYRALERGSKELNPGIPIVLHGPGARLPIIGLLDTGADEALFPYVLSSTLGLDPADCTVIKCRTAGGIAEQYVWEKAKLEVEVQGTGGIRFPVKASFSKLLPESFALLGLRDFFEVFVVTFDQRARSFTLEAYD